VITKRTPADYAEALVPGPVVVRSWPDDKTFLGDSTDVASGLTYIGAREYEAGTGRFISVDPVLSAADGQSLNGYTYADNNPVTLSDPTGNEIGSRPNSCQYDLANCSKKVQKEVGYDPSTGLADPSKGTATTSSTGHTKKKSSGWGWLSSAVHTVVDYGTAVFSQPDVWIGGAETVGSMFLMGFGGDAVIGGGALCLTGIGCLAGAPAVAGGVGLIGVGAVGTADGIGRINDGLGTALREAEGDSGSASSSSGEFLNEAEKATDDEIYAAKKVASQGNRVVLRDPPADGGTRGVDTSDVLINGVQGDIYSPTSGNMDRISGAISKKRNQVDGGYVILNLKNSPVDAGDVKVDSLLNRVNSRPGSSSPLSGIFVIQ